MRKVQSVRKEAFQKYGEVLEFPKDCDQNFRIVVAEETQPWRLAVFRYKNKTIKTLECHPSSFESFEPLEGVTVLVVAEPDTPEQYEAFFLDKPVCLKKGVWHQVLSITDEAQVKITENLEVASQFFELEKEIEILIG